MVIEWVEPIDPINRFREAFVKRRKVWAHVKMTRRVGGSFNLDLIEDWAFVNTNRLVGWWWSRKLFKARRKAMDREEHDRVHGNEWQSITELPPARLLTPSDK